MKLTKNEWLHTGRWIGQWLIAVSLLGMALGDRAMAQAVSTTTVQGTVYLANGGVGAGTLDVSWPAFTTSNSQAITAGRVTVTIGQDGFVSVNLAPNLGATPAGLYYTAIYHMSDGTTSTEYWVVPAAAQANLGQVRAQLMPSAQAVQAVSKAYVDQSITELTQSLLTATGGTLSGPLYLSGDPTQALQAADKHYVDSAFGLAVPLAGGSMTGALATPTVNGVQAPVAGSTQTTIQAAVSAAGTSGAVEIPPTYTGSDGFTNPNGVHVTDLRQTGAQQFERSVKEFGAVCDGTTDDTNALQAALNYAQTHGVALTIPQGLCKTHVLSWRGESIGGMGKQVSALMGFPGQDVLATATDSTTLLGNTRLHDLTIYVDQSMDVSCSAATGRAPAGSCTMSRLLESNSIFSPGGNGLTGAVGTGTAWAVGNCAIAMPAATGTSGNGLRLAVIENLEIAATGVDPMAQYTGAHSTHTCGLYLAQWPQWSEFRNIDIRGLNTGIAMPALPGTTPAGLNADSNRWQNITIQATHGFTAATGSNNVLDNVVVVAANSAATSEPPTGLVLDLAGTQQGWTVRNAVVLPAWNVVSPTLTVTAAGGAVTAVTAGTEKGLGFDPYGTTVPLKFSGSCTAAAAANVRSDGSIGTISVTQGGVGCSGTTTASVNVDGTWDTAAPVNLIAGQNMTLFGGNLQKGNGGYTVWNAAGSRTSGTIMGGGGGTLPGGGSYTGLVASSSLGSTTQVDQFPGTDFGAKLQACLGSISTTYGGTCDARNFTGNLSMASNLTVSTANVTALLPCATISTAAQVIVTAGTRNVALRGCALRGASTASGSQGGTVFLYSGTGAMVQVGDPTYAADTMGFHLDNVVINTTASSSATAQGLTAYRTQEMDLESLYFLGNQNQTGMTLDGTGNYTGGTFLDDAFNGFQTAVNAIGHQVSNAAMTDWMNASAFVRLHIDCPTSAGNPISGTYGINLQQGDGNTFTGGDVENCSTALHLGANAQNNTIIGLRNENSTNQVVADAGSSYNNWMTGGTMFTGQLTDNGTRNSFMDTFHRSFNGIKGDWYGSQQDATVTNHYRIGIGTGNERGLLNRYQTDYGYRWTTGLSDATAGEQFFQVQDELNNVNRLSIGQYNNGQSSTNNQTVINAAGTGAIVLNGSNNAGTGGVIIGSGGASESTVATITNTGNAQFNGTLQVGGASTFTGSTTVKNQANAEIDQFLWAGTTASQKESFTYKDYNGSSQWYMVKDANNNWALNSATGGLDSFKAYQSGNSGDTYIDTSNSSGVIRLNYESGSSGRTYIYGGTSSSLIAAFSGTTAIAFPGLAASSGHNCLQIDNSGYISNTGSACGTGSGGTNGTVSSGNMGQIAYYATNGTSLSGMSAVPVTAGGTGAATAAGALAALGAQAAIPGLSADGQSTPGIQVSGTVAANNSIPALTPYADIRAYGALCNGLHDDTASVQSAINAAMGAGGSGRVFIPDGCYIANGSQFGNPNSQNVLTFEMSGKAAFGSTFVLPLGAAVMCQGKGNNPQFATGSPTCNIQAPQVFGTIGTATTSTNTPVTFTPTFSGGTIANMPVGSAITVAGTVTCAISSVTRTALSGTYPGPGGANVTATFTGPCRIPPAAQITVAGVTDSTFNGTYFSASVDFPLQTLTWREVGAASASTGGTITGFNLDSFETARISAVSGNTVTATFNHAHSASDVWGMVGMAGTQGDLRYKVIKGVSVTSNYGAGFWGDNNVGLEFDGVSLTGNAYLTAIPMEMSTSWGWTFERSQTNGWGPYTCPTASYGCGPVGPPFSVMIDMLPQSVQGTNAVGSGYFGINDYIEEGIYITTNGSGVAYANIPVIEDSAIEQPMWNGITIDPRQVSSITQGTIKDSLMQDNAVGWSTAAWIGLSDNGAPRQGQINFYDALNLSYSGTVNKYWCGNVGIYGKSNYDNLAMPACPSATVSYDDGNAHVGALNSNNPAFNFIPFATQNIPTNPMAWSCRGTGCSLTTGVADPFGGTNAAQITSTTNYVSVPLSFYVTSNQGDVLLYGGWIRGNGDITLTTYGADTFDTKDVAGYAPQISNLWWHPVVGMSVVQTGAAYHPLELDLWASTQTTGTSSQFYQPFAIYIPASAGIPMDEIKRWRTTLLHGYVPAGLPSAALVINPSLPLYSGTSLFGTANLGDWTNTGIANGYIPQWNGTSSKWSPIALISSALSDWTNSGAANGYVPEWNSTTGKWTPTALPSTVANVTFTTSTASVAANTCNATVQVAMSGVTTSMAFSITPTADTSSATGWGSTGGLVLDTWPTVGYLNYKICNQTTAAISSPGAVTFNVSAR